MLRFALAILIMVSTVWLNVTYADTKLVKRHDVQSFIDMMVKKHQFKKQKLIALFKQVKLHPQVIKSINKPLEAKPWRTYQMLFVNEWRINHGVTFWNKYSSTLKRAEKKFGVPASVIVATVGIETKYGQRTGGYRVIDSLTNLAFNHTARSRFFRKELVHFLLLTREKNLDPLKIRGSYAGAIGQPQFMPSSYRHYAINFSKTGTTDLMNDEIDVIGSVANYYQKHGWKKNQPIAIQARVLPSKLKKYLKNKNKLKRALTIAQFAKYGVVPKTPLKNKKIRLKAQLLELEGTYKKEYWFVFHNFNVIKRYNTSNLYAMAVYQLSGYIEALRKRLNHG